MEVIPSFIQDPSPTLLLDALQGLASLCALLLAAHGIKTLLARRPFAVRLPVRPDLASTLSLGALATLISPAAAFATPMRTDVSPRSVVKSSPALDERVLVPPPRSLVRAGASHRSSVHPAIHGGGSVANAGGSAGRPGPLFPRSINAPTTHDQLDPWERGVDDLRRAEGTQASHERATGRFPEAELTHHAVLPGETLWGIAAKVLKTDDQRAIARYWPRIHRENRDIIGGNPDLIRPGQVLSLPTKEQA